MAKSRMQMQHSKCLIIRRCRLKAAGQQCGEYDVRMKFELDIIIYEIFLAFKLYEENSFSTALIYSPHLYSHN